MKMVITNKTWDNKTGEVVSETKYTLVKKKGKDGLMHTVSENTEVIVEEK